MAFPGEENLHEIRQHRDLIALPADVTAVHRKKTIGSICVTSFRTKETIEHRATDALDRECRDCASHVTTGVTILKSANEDGIECRAGYDAELPARRYGAGKLPVGDGDTHSTLDDYGERTAVDHVACFRERKLHDTTPKWVLLSGDGHRFGGEIPDKVNWFTTGGGMRVNCGRPVAVATIVTDPVSSSRSVLSSSMTTSESCRDLGS